MQFRILHEVWGKSHSSSPVFAQRLAGELDEEALTLTESVLRPNPEILTLWNYRREVFIKREEDL